MLPTTKYSSHPTASTDGKVTPYFNVSIKELHLYQNLPLLQIHRTLHDSVLIRTNNDNHMQLVTRNQDYIVIITFGLQV